MNRIHVQQKLFDPDPEGKMKRIPIRRTKWYSSGFEIIYFFEAGSTTLILNSAGVNPEKKIIIRIRIMIHIMIHDHIDYLDSERQRGK